MYSLKTCAIGIGTSKTYMDGVFSHCDYFFLVKTEFIFYSNSYLAAIFVPEKYTKLFLQYDIAI